jgi:hypothetical protein
MNRMVDGYGLHQIYDTAHVCVRVRRLFTKYDLEKAAPRELPNRLARLRALCRKSVGPLEMLNIDLLRET